MVGKLRQILCFSLLALAVAAFVILDSAKFPFLYSPPVAAQVTKLQDVADQVYQRIPDFPKENQYVSRQTNKVAADNTLVKRLIQYHTLVKGRSPIYRLDWKITLADYLGLNDLLEKSTYPAHALLKTNPMAGDRAAINRLNRVQRDRLVQVLVDIYTTQSNPAAQPSSDTSSPNSSTTTSSSATPETQSAQQHQPLPASGGAEPFMSRSPKAQLSPQPAGEAQLLKPASEA
jgi:hypothetical protein